MTKEEIIEGNKLIAEFMGGVYDSDVNEYWFYLNPPNWISKFAPTTYELKYHSSWDWLMPCIDRIILIDMGVPHMRRIYFNTFRCRKNHPTEYTYKVRIHNDFKDILIKTESNSEIEATWLAVTQFIKWYNSCKKE